MPSALDNYKICEKIPDILKQQIKLFYVFDVSDGYNTLFVTFDDMVYGFGSNWFVQQWLGHNTPIETPVEVPELHHKNIQQFFNGEDFVLALNNDNYIYSFGYNKWGQLGMGLNGLPYNKPKHISYFSENLFKFDQISCGNNHTNFILILLNVLE